MLIYTHYALGSTLNPFTINRLKCSVVAGAANNQLEDELRDFELLMKNRVLYAPDFLINAGGLINVYSELNGYDKDEALKQTSDIYNTTLNIFKTSEIEKVNTIMSTLLKIAQERINKQKICLLAAIRLKVMQSLYSYFSNANEIHGIFPNMKKMISHFADVRRLYLLLFSLLIEIINYTDKFLDESKNKFFPKESDFQNPNKRFVINQFSQGDLKKQIVIK